MATKLFLLLVFIGLCRFCYCTSEKHLHLRIHEAYEHLIKDKPVKKMTIDELGVSEGVCKYSFMPYVGYEDTAICYMDDKYILHILAVPQEKTSSTFVNCLRKHPLQINSTNEIILITTSQEIEDLLRPIGNSSKYYHRGSCVLVYFYTTSCFGCQLFAVPIVETAYAYKTMHVAAIDAFKFPILNYKFRIVGLPTILLFHQGRGVIKYNGQGSVIAFVEKHTRLQPEKVPKIVDAYALLGFTDDSPTDYTLVLAWLFILSCAGYYFSLWRLFKKVVEKIKRKFRQSEAHLETN